MQRSCQNLTRALTSIEQKLDALVEVIEGEEDKRTVRLQHLAGLSVTEIRASKHKAVSDTDKVIEEAEAMIKALEEQDLGTEEVDQEDAEVFNDTRKQGAEAAAGQRRTRPLHGLWGEDSSIMILSMQPRKRTDSTVPLPGNLGEPHQEASPVQDRDATA